MILDRDSANDLLLILLHQETDGADRDKTLLELTETINQLIREAADFRVLAKNIRAIGK